MQTIVLPAQVKHGDASAVLELLKTNLSAAGGPTLVDASGLTQFDSSALAVLLDARRESLGRGSTLQVTNWPEGLLRLAKVYGVSELLQAPA
jgi:phospholipid transport system transporter-binding protein